MQNMEQTNVKPGLSFSLKWGKIRIFHTTIVALSNPKYIHFLLNPDDKLFAVQGSDLKTAESFEVPEYDDSEKWVFTISTTPLLNAIWSMCRWNRAMTYRVFGFPNQRQNVVVFDLNQAVALEDEMQ